MLGSRRWTDFGARHPATPGELDLDPLGVAADPGFVGPFEEVALDFRLAGGDHAKLQGTSLAHHVDFPVSGIQRFHKIPGFLVVMGTAGHHPTVASVATAGRGGAE